MQAHGQEEMFMGHNRMFMGHNRWSSQSSWMEFGSVAVSNFFGSNVTKLYHVCLGNPNVSFKY